MVGRKSRKTIIIRIEIGTSIIDGRNEGTFTETGMGETTIIWTSEEFRRLSR